jgi:hypothetical protein
MTDMVIVMLGLFSGVASYLVNPCGLDQLALVKAARSAPGSMPTSSRGADRVSEPVEAAVFERDLAGVPA